MKEVLDELSNPNFLAAITSFVKNYGRDVPSADVGGTEANVGTGEQVAGPCQCCAIPHSVSANRGGGQGSMEQVCQ